MKSGLVPCLPMFERINKETMLCISLAGRPGNQGTRFHNFLYRELGLNYVYKDLLAFRE